MHQKSNCATVSAKLMASIKITSWTPPRRHFTFGHGLAQTWWHQRE
jgi:hypothetical protein